MCSIGDDNLVDEGISSLMTPQEQMLHYLPKATCYKCGKEDELYKIHFREAECENCFLMFVNHKFRATVGSSKALPRNADILLVFDGSAESVVLLDMLQTAKSEPNFKRLHCFLKVLFIDDYEAYKGSCEINDYKLYIQQVKDLLLSYDNIKCYVTNLRSSIHQKPFGIKDMDLYLNREMEKEKVFSNDIKNIQTSTSRNEFIKLYRKNLIASMATILSCKYAFIPAINISIATDLLSAVALGQGNNAAYDVAFKDDRLINGIKIMRPIKDLSETEVLLYLRARNIKWWDIRDHVIIASSSIQQITGSFIRNLQKKYNSTVSTIICTGNKITSNNDSYEEFEKKCCLCNSSIVNSETLSAVRYSRYVSERTSSDFDLDTNFTKFLNLTQNQDQKVCHSCQNIGRDSDINLIKHYL